MNAQKRDASLFNAYLNTADAPKNTDITVGTVTILN